MAFNCKILKISGMKKLLQTPAHVNAGYLKDEML